MLADGRWWACVLVVPSPSVAGIASRPRRERRRARRVAHTNRTLQAPSIAGELRSVARIAAAVIDRAAPRRDGKASRSPAPSGFAQLVRGAADILRRRRSARPPPPRHRPLTFLRPLPPLARTCFWRDSWRGRYMPRSRCTPWMLGPRTSSPQYTSSTHPPRRARLACPRIAVWRISSRRRPRRRRTRASPHRRSAHRPDSARCSSPSTVPPLERCCTRSALEAAQGSSVSVSVSEPEPEPGWRPMIPREACSSFPVDCRCPSPTRCRPQR
jgi:hypothetical protein